MFVNKNQILSSISKKIGDSDTLEYKLNKITIKSDLSATTGIDEDRFFDGLIGQLNLQAIKDFCTGDIFNLMKGDFSNISKQLTERIILKLLDRGLIAESGNRFANSIVFYTYIKNDIPTQKITLRNIRKLSLNNSSKNFNEISITQLLKELKNSNQLSIKITIKSLREIINICVENGQITITDTNKLVCL